MVSCPKLVTDFVLRFPLYRGSKVQTKTAPDTRSTKDLLGMLVLYMRPKFGTDYPIAELRGSGGSGSS